MNNDAAAQLLAVLEKTISAGNNFPITLEILGAILVFFIFQTKTS